MRTIFDYRKRSGTSGILPELDVPGKGSRDLLPSGLLRRSELRIPNLSEPEVVRHYTALSKLNYGVDDGLYPLGSCTMKYNPKVNEDVARLPGFASIHPGTDPQLAQGSLAVMHDMSRLLRRIAGMADVTLQPAAGAHGEITGMFLIKRYFEARGEAERTRILLPDSAHGTNPASAAAAGFSVTEIKSGPDGLVDLNELSGELDDTVAGVMLTVPNTLGIFEENIIKITAMVHAAGGLCYFDGANLNS
ncbi:MAG TPA: aminomethyl-transferring glycine dehydrogenase subunit GcvPB, partial [Candidatus Acetothermia bacterium]|nr:aminomethyl-transferring glycine dehydrogenase subunit GcvPB [Candidatus Acetothermia bacterium]